MTDSLLRAFYTASALFFFCSIFSCNTTKKIKYFQDIPDSGKLNVINGSEFIDPPVQRGDILTVIIQTVDPNASAPINLGNVPVSATGIQNGVPTFNQQFNSGYPVNKDGDIELPVLGKIKVVGYTLVQVKDTIEKLCSNYFKDPAIIVRYANFKITIAGEVTKPGEYIFPNEKTTILDALADAGDLTIFGKRDNVLLLRENQDGSKTPYRINLKKANIISQPYFYLRQNDYIYVQPTNAKAAVNDAAQTRNIAIISGALSVLIIFLTRSK